jgi:hypothetical protein
LPDGCRCKARPADGADSWPAGAVEIGAARCGPRHADTRANRPLLRPCQGCRWPAADRLLRRRSPRPSARRKSWTYFFTRGGERVRWTFGTYPATSLAKAHTRADEARAALEAGKDPRTSLANPETLRAICEEWTEREGGALRTRDDRKATLERLV